MITLEAGLPKVIALRVKMRRGEPADVEAYGQKRGDLVFTGSLREAAIWLYTFGYSWCVGVDGVWARV